jgi:CRISPR/Cas system CSM-associated protein Csm4 (group 5 of RAMP superfamily)
MLSLFHPASGDSIDWGRGSYSLTTRGGRVESPASWGDAKKPTRMIAEGSVIVAAAEPRGSASNVAPDHFPHPVYRAGFALAVPIPLGPTERRDRMERVITLPPGPSA